MKNNLCSVCNEGHNGEKCKLTACACELCHREKKSAENIVILDASSGKVYIVPTNEKELELDAGEILERVAGELHIRTSDCEYMLTNSDDLIDLR